MTVAIKAHPERFHNHMEVCQPSRASLAVLDDQNSQQTERLNIFAELQYQWLLDGVRTYTQQKDYDRSHRDGGRRAWGRETGGFKRPVPTRVGLI